MECPTCFLRYNSTQRKPKVVSCGHTICSGCLKKSKKCRICGTVILNDKNYTVNFSLMQIIEKDSKQIDKYVKVCFVGSSTTGKTSLIKRMMGNSFSEQTVTTIGYDFSFQDRKVDQLQIRYQLWDSAGQQKYRAISPIHYKNADIVVIVYDVTQTSSDNKLSYWIQQSLKNCPQNVKIMIVGNKLDLAQENKVFKPIQEEGWQTINKEGYLHMEISCKTTVGIEQVWQALDNQLRKRIAQKSKSMIQYQKQLDEIEKRRAKITKIKKKQNQTSGSKYSSNDSCC